MKVTPGMLMKTKDSEKKCQDSGARCQEKSPGSKVRCRADKFGSQKPDSLDINAITSLDSVSWLLSPALKNEGDSGDVDENKGRLKKVSGIRCQVSGKKSEVRMTEP